MITILQNGNSFQKQTLKEDSYIHLAKELEKKGYSVNINREEKSLLINKRKALLNDIVVIFNNNLWIYSRDEYESFINNLY